MGSDLVVALGPATLGGNTLVGFNGHRPPGERQALRQAPGRAFVVSGAVALPRVGARPRQCLALITITDFRGPWGASCRFAFRGLIGAH